MKNKKNHLKKILALAITVTIFAGNTICFSDEFNQAQEVNMEQAASEDKTVLQDILKNSDSEGSLETDVSLAQTTELSLSAAESSPVPNSTNKKITFDLDAYDFTDPSKLAAPVPKFLTDEKFFGKWDSATNSYTIEGKLNYNYVSPQRYDLKKVEEAVKEGNYDTAKAELLEYYRNVTSARGLSAPSSSRTQTLTSNLLLQCFHYNGSSGQTLADIFPLSSGEWSWVQAEMISAVETYRNSANKLMPLYLYAVNKDEYEAEFYSKEGNPEFAPYLEVVAGGSTLKIPVKADTYVSAGDNAGNNYGSEQKLLARECVGGWATPVTSDTKQIYLMFDLSSIQEGTPITSAKLKMYGRWVDKAQTPRNNPNYKKNMVAFANANTWEESTVNFVTVLHPALSYDGQYGFDWLSPVNAKVNGSSVTTWHVRINQEMLRFSSWWDVLTNEYRATGDEDYARAAMMYLDNFIKETFYVYMGMPGGVYDGWTAKDYSIGGQKPSKTVFVSNWKPYSDQGMEAYGGYSETLDASTRASCLAANLKNLYGSEYMTPEIFTTFVKYMWSMGDWSFKNWSSSEAGGNWGTAQCSAAYKIMANFPEFTDINRVQSFTTYTNYGAYNGKVRTGSWMDMMWENLKQVALDNVVHSDGSSGELSLSYTDYALSTITGIKGTADSLDIPVEYSQDLQDGIKELVKYIINKSLPGFYDNQMGDGTAFSRNFKDGRIVPIADWLQDPFLLWAAYDGKKGKAPDYTSYFYNVGKTLTMRSDWSKDALYLHIDADGGSGTHAHWDDLAVIVSAYGDYLLTDPLYYVQNANDPARRWLVSSKGHNTVEINDYCQSGINPSNVDSVLPKGGGQGTFEKVELNNSYDFTKVFGGPNFKNLAYRDTSSESFLRDKLPTAAEPGMDYKRNVLFVRPNFWIVSDYMNPVDKNKVNKYTQMWHMRADSDMRIDGQYELKDGEKIGEVNGVPDAISPDIVIQKNMQVSNTQYVPGTGTGAFYSSNPKGANIKVVPADINAVTPKLQYGVYHPNLIVPYGVFEKNVKGTTSMDSVLFPTKSGEDYSVTPEPLEIDMPEGSASAFTSTVKDLSGNTNTEYNFSYYILHESDKKKNVAFGSYEADGTLAYYETSASGTPRRLIVEETKNFVDNDLKSKVLYSTQEVPDLSVEWVGSELHLDTSKTIDLQGLSILSPINVSKVTLNGKTISFKQNNNYVYFGATPLIEGEPIITPPTSDSPSGGGSNHGTGGSGGTGSTGGTYIPVPTEQPEFENELSGHWGETEIRELVEKGIVTGYDGSLHLQDNTTRGEFLKLLLSAMDIKPAEYKGSFNDVSENDWYAGYIQAAFDLNILEGSDGNAMPIDFITREQAVKIMIKVLQTKKEITLPDGGLIFEDSNQISDWAKPYCAAAVEMGLIKGIDDNKFMPENNTLREQAMIITYRLMKEE